MGASGEILEKALGSVGADLAPGSGGPLDEGRVSITKNGASSGKPGQYFEGVPPKVWDFRVGGPQVCETWLKDRRGRTLTYEDIMHDHQAVRAL